MFGNVKWFDFSKTWVVPPPASRFGWIYYAAWAAAIVIPSVMLSYFGLIFPELLIWLAVAGCGFFLDVRKVRLAGLERRAFNNLHYIDDRSTGIAETEEYQLEVKK